VHAIASAAAVAAGMGACWVPMQRIRAIGCHVYSRCCCSKGSGTWETARRVGKMVCKARPGAATAGGARERQGRPLRACYETHAAGKRRQQGT